jgi:hypothetical protein
MPFDTPTPSVFQRYAKAVVAAAGTAALVAQAIASGDYSTWQGVLAAVLAVATVAGVRQFPNAE